MALNYPLDLRDRAKVYLDWGTAVIFKYWTADRYLQHRHEAVVPLLTGLKLMLDNRVPEATVELPGVGKFDVQASDPEYQEIVRKHQLQEEARKRAVALNELIEVRIALTGTISSLYSFGTDATQELKEMSSQILRNDAAVAALLAKTKEERATHIRKKISTLYQGQISCL